MANVFDKLFSIFKPKEEEPQQQNVGVAKMAFRMNGSEHPESYSVASYTPKEGGLAGRAIQNASALGQDWSKADTNTQQFVTEYYRTLDDPANVKLYKDVEALYGSDGADFDEVYGRGHTQIGNRLNEAEAMYGKDSAQYRAVQRFMQDYEDMGRTMSSTFVNSQKVQSSNTLDQTIENVYSGVVNRDDFWEVAKQGEERLSGIKGAFMPDMDGASKLQKALYYYTFATDGADAAKDMYNRFLGDTVNFQKAAADYCSDIMNNPTKLGRAWEADKANFAAAMAQTFGGIQQTFTNTKADPDDKTLANGYTISDSVDDYLRSFMGEVADEKSLQLGGEVFKQLNQYLGSEDWYKTAEKDASDYQKKVLGYMAYTYQSPEAAKEIWDIIKERNDEIWNLTKGSQSLATKAASYEGQMYDRYLGLSGDKLIGDRTVAQVVWDTALTTRAQYPQIAANIAGAMIGSPLVGQILGNAVMATSVYGNSYKQAVDEGKDIDASIGYAATQAASEFAVGMMLDGIAPIAGSLTGKAGTRFVESIANPFIKAVVKGGIRGLGEGLEEYIQEIAEPAIRNLWFHEGNEVPLYSEDALYSFFLGSISALAMSSFSTRAEAKLNTRYAEIGKAIKSQQSDSKLVDLILNNPVRTGTKEQLELYNEAKEKAQLIRSGKLTPTDIVAGELLAKYAQAGGDVSFLSNPATIRYTKEQITYNDMVAGAKSMLTELGADIEMAYDIAKLATGQAISEEAQAKINASTQAQDVLSQLQGDLDMSVNNALTRAARATTIDGVLNKVYTTLQNENPDKHVASPAAAYLINEGGYKLADAEKIGNVINKVLDGIEVTEDEAKLIKASSPAIRGALLTQADIELSEFDDTKTVLGKLNEAAAARHDIAEKQAAVKESVKTATKVRPIPKNAATAQGGISTNEQSGLAGDRAESARGRGEGIPRGTGQSVEGAQGVGGLSQDQHRRGLQPGAGTGAATEVDGQETVIPANKLDEKQRAIHRRLVSLGAQLVEFIFGEDSSCGWDSERGAYVIRIRADGQFTQEQYAKHEPVHLWISALSDEYRKFILNAWRKGFGADFDKAFDFVRGLYERKGYLKGLDGDKISYLIAEETLAMARAGQSYKGFNFAKYQDLANDFIESFNLEAIGTGDLSNPEVDAALKEGRINRTYYERQGFLDTDDSISIGDAMQNRSADDIEEENYGRERSSTDEDRISRRRAEQHLAHPDLGLLGGQLAFPSSSSYGIGEARSAREQVHNDIIQSKIIPAGGKIVPLENATEAAKDIVSIINRLAPDCLVSVVDKLPTPFTPAQFERGGRSGIDGGIFVNQTDVHRFALLYRIPEEKIAAVVATHELGHYFLYRAGKNGSTVLSYVKSKLRPRQLVQLTSAINSYEDLGKNDTERREELFCDLLAGIQRTEQAKKIDSSVRALVEDCFVKETGYGEAIKAYGDLAASEDRASYSADDDPEYYNSIGLIDTDGTAVTFTDNVGGVHEEIISQLKGHPGEDVQDFIRRGGIRVKPGYGIEVNGDIAPTTEQYRLIDKIVRNFDGEEFNIDYNIDGTVVGTKTFSGADISEDNIYNELRRFRNSRKRDKALKNRLDKYTKLFGLPVTTMKQAYELAKMFTQYEGPDPDYQEIIDAFEGQRYSADDILDPESESYLGPEIDANTLANAREEDVYSNQDIWFRNGEDAELSTDEDAIEATAAQNEDSVEARFTALMDELEAHPERADEIFAQIKELQEQAFNKTKAVDEVKKPAEKKEKPAKAKATEKTTAPKKKETPVQMAFKPKAEVEAKNAPITEAAAEPEPEIGKNEEAINSLLEELDENPALANDPDFLARVDEIAGDIAQREANLSSADRAFQPAAEVEAATTAEAEAVAELNREQNEANEFSNIGRQEIAEKIKENQQAEIKDDTRYTKKTGEWWKRIGAADSIEIRRRRADRNTFDVRFTDRNGNVVTYEDVSPSMLVNAFMSKLNSRELAKQRTAEAIALAAQPSAEWSTYENAKPEEKKQVTVRKKDIPRDRDNYGRKIPVKLAERMSQSTVRDRNGALLSTYRLAPANGVHNAKLPGKVSFYTERPSTANTLRGLSGAEAYGQPGKSSEELIRGWLDQLADPKTSKEDAAKIRSQIAKEERKQREYTSGVTRLDPWRPGFEFATPQNIVNGKSLLEVYLDIRKPQTVDAKGQGLDFVQKTVQEYTKDPANKAGLFDGNNDPLGPHDGFKFTNVRVVPEGSTLGGGNLDLDTVYVTLRNNQAKSTYNTAPTDSDLVQYSADDIDTGFTEGTLEDTILKILSDKDEDRAVAALTEYLAQFLQTGVLPEIEDPKTRNIFQPQVTPGQRKIIEDKLADYTKKYGALEEGENPARKIVLPKRTDDGYVRRVFRTAAESKHTPDRAVPAIERKVVQDEGAAYQRITDRAATAYADREMRKKGFDRVKADWQGKLDVEGNKITKNDVALGELLYIEAVKVGDMETAMSTLAELAEIGTTAGQVVQAFRMLKNMPKSYQLYYFQRVINRLNRQFSKRIESGKMQELKISKPFAKAVLDAKTEKELNDAIDELIQHVADQIPATLADKWNAWRYFAMLGNPKTHIRNMFGNALFAPAKFMKNLIAAGLETTFIKDANERQTSFKGLLDRKGTAEYRAFAEEDFEGIKGELQSGGKYNPTNRILEARTMFKFKPLEKLRRLSGDLLEREDGIFLKAHYVNALTNFLATRGLSVADLSGTREGAKVLNAARQYAFTEAQKATYRDASQVATALNQLKRIPVLGTLVEGLLPFTKTPINILKRGIEYSPVGLLKTVALETSKLKNGDISANEYIDNISAGLTGTGIVLLGVLLSSLGILRGGDDDDDKQADFDTLQGYQNYSINAGGYNYTIDWMAPSALPLFVGSALYNEMQSKGGISPADLLNITSAIAEPITQLSMLSGLNDALKTAKWDENPLSSVAMAMASGYASQGIPTVLAQISRSLTPDRRTTYVDKNSDVPQALQRWWQTNVMGKTPLNYQRAEYIDAWGRKDTTQSFALRLVENMLSPGYLNKIETTPVDEELQRLANATGTAVLMTPAERKIEFNNETHNLTAEQYAVYAKTRGDATMTMLTELFNSVAYADMSDEEKAKAVSYIKAYGNSLGKSAVFPEYSNDDDNWARKCDGDSTRLINMALLKAEASNAGLTAGNNGEFYSMIVHSDWLGPVEQAYAIAQQYTTTSDKAYVSKGGPTYDLTKERKDQMYEYYRMIFPEYYVELVNSQEWNAANDEKKMDLLSDLRKDVGTTAKIWLAQQLSAAGVPSDY